MKAIVRDDIIKLETYVNCEFKHKEFIEILAGVGGYCFLDQIIRTYTKHYADTLMKDNIINTYIYSNFKFAKLSSSALKYLEYRDDMEDYSHIEKSELTSKTLTNKPSQKSLFSSVINFHNYMLYKGIDGENNKDSYEVYRRDLHEQHLKDVLTGKQIKELKSLENNYEKNKEIYKRYYEFVYEKKLAQDLNLKDEMYQIRGEIRDIESKLNERVNILTAEENILKKNTKNIEFNMETNKDINLLYRNIESLFTKVNNANDYFLNMKNDYIKKQKIIKERMTYLNENIKETDEIIRVILQTRDISKVIIYFEADTMHVISNFIRNPSYNFFKEYKNNCITSITNFLGNYRLMDLKEAKQPLVIEVKKIKFRFNSIFENERDVKKIESRLNQLFGPYSRYSNTRQKIEFVTSVASNESNLRKYFDNISYDVQYIKPEHIDDFEALREHFGQKR